ncbi:MAG TPA: TolC family protein [Gemmataceae bacterium]|nr:TolC family protein [Gemmataceae bacterium]
MTQRIARLIVPKRQRRTALALGAIVAFASGCSLFQAEQPVPQERPLSAQSKQAPTVTAVWKNPLAENKSAVVPAQVVIPAPDGPADQKKPSSTLPEPPSVAALLAPVIPPPAGESPVDLQIALSIASSNNPTIGLGEEAVRAALAERMAARALLLPTVNPGLNFRIHSGNLLGGAGTIRYDDVDSLYAGLGAYARAADTVAIPGVRIFAQLGDAIFEPRLAAIRVQARSFDWAAVRNQVLLEVVQRYFELLGAETRLGALRQSETEIAEIMRLTSNFAKAGQGREGDAQRALAEAELMRADAQLVEEEAAVAAAQLASLLSMDPSIRLHTDPSTLAPIALVDEHADMSDLLRTAASNRPEVSARLAEIREAQTRLRQNRLRPLFPLLSVGFSYGTFGGGGNVAATPFGNFSGRTDFDVLAVWSLENLGFGNRAINNRARSNVRQAELAEAAVLDDIGREVGEAQALIVAARQRMEAAGREMLVAQDGFQEELTRTRNLAARPIEVLNSLNQLRRARQSVIQATIDYNQAQFRLYVALGQPPLP